MFNKKDKKAEKPSRFKIDNAMDTCKESIQNMLNSYDENIDMYTDKIVALRKAKRNAEANRFIEKLKQTMYRRERMSQLYDQVEAFNMMINEAFAKQEVYKTLGTAIGEVNKLNISPEMKTIMKDMKEFESTFAKGLNSFDSIFSNIGKSMNHIDLDTSNEYDSEITAIVNDKIANMEKTSLNVDENEEELDDILKSL